MRDRHLEVFLRHPEVVALAIVAMTILSSTGPTYFLLRFVGLF